MNAARPDGRPRPVGPPYHDAVERVATALRERVDEPWTLQGMARIAYLSPFHFNRVFRRVTGTPPGRFLSALRMAQARRLLLATSLTITDVCTEVGYSSLGTFTTQFTEQVGVTPGRLRQMHEVYGERPLGDLLGSLVGRRDPEHLLAGGRVSGILDAGPGPDRLILVGVFPGPVAQGQPIACTTMAASGGFLLPVPTGTFHVLATAHPAQSTVGQMIAGDPPTGSWVGAADRQVTVRTGEVTGPVRLALRPSTPTNPPVLSGLPLLNLTPAA